MIDWNALRARAEFAGDVLDIPEAEVRRIMHATDDQLNDAGFLAPFIHKHGLSWDWLVGGDVTGMLRIVAREFKREERGAGW